MRSDLESTWWRPLRLLARVMVRPREVIRDILDSLPDDYAIPLVIGATLSQFLVEDDFDQLTAALRHVSINVGGLIVLGTTVLIALFTIVVFYAFSYFASWVGRLIGGRGNAEQIRSALAWGSAPMVWAALYRIPVRMIWGAPVIDLVRSRDDGSGLLEAVSAASVPSGAILAPLLAFALLEATAAIWYLVLMSRCVGEAHAFSAWRGFASLALSIVVPIITLVTVIAACVAVITLVGG